MNLDIHLNALPLSYTQSHFEKKPLLSHTFRPNVNSPEVLIVMKVRYLTINHHKVLANCVFIDGRNYSIYGNELCLFSGFIQDFDL